MTTATESTNVETKNGFGFCDQCGGGDRSYDMHEWVGYGSLCSSCHEAMLKGTISPRMQGRAFRPLETTI